MTTESTIFPLQIPGSLKAAIANVAAEEGITINQFLVLAAAEKLATIQTAETFFAMRKGRGDVEAAIRFLTRTGGEVPSQGDELFFPNA